MIPHGVTRYNELSATTVITHSHNLQKPTGFSNIQQIYSSVFRVHDSIYALLILLVAYGRVSMLQQNIYDDVTVAFRITGLLWWESTCGWCPYEGRSCSYLTFSLLLAQTSCLTNSRISDDLRPWRLYDVTVIWLIFLIAIGCSNHQLHKNIIRQYAIVW